MTELDPVVEQRLADMPEADFDALIARVRPPEEPVDPKARATAALRREMGFNVRGRKPSKEAAADALRRFTAGR